MRTNAKERKSKARQWYSLLINSYNSKSAVVVQRYESLNPNISRVQLLAWNTIGKPVVISESIHGITGCLCELLQNIKKLDTVRTYYENDFNDWLSENYNICITYNDGMVLMIEREDKEWNNDFKNKLSEEYDGNKKTQNKK